MKTYFQKFKNWVSVIVDHSSETIGSHVRLQSRDYARIYFFYLVCAVLMLLVTIFWNIPSLTTNEVLENKDEAALTMRQAAMDDFSGWTFFGKSLNYFNIASLIMLCIPLFLRKLNQRVTVVFPIVTQVVSSLVMIKMIGVFFFINSTGRSEAIEKGVDFHEDLLIMGLAAKLTFLLTVMLVVLLFYLNSLVTEERNKIAFENAKSGREGSISGQNAQISQNITNRFRSVVPDSIKSSGSSTINRVFCILVGICKDAPGNVFVMISSLLTFFAVLSPYDSVFGYVLSPLWILLLLIGCIGAAAGLFLKIRYYRPASIAVMLLIDVFCLLSNNSVHGEGAMLVRTPIGIGVFMLYDAIFFAVPALLLAVIPYVPFVNEKAAGLRRKMLSNFSAFYHLSYAKFFITGNVLLAISTYLPVVYRGIYTKVWGIDPDKVITLHNYGAEFYILIPIVITFLLIALRKDPMLISVGHVLFGFIFSIYRFFHLSNQYGDFQYHTSHPVSGIIVLFAASVIMGIGCWHTLTEWGEMTKKEEPLNQNKIR